MTMLNIVGHTTIAGCNVRVGNSVFTPAALFSAGEQGVWYDPSDFSTLYQDTSGSTPVTAVEQPVGMMLDKSQGLTLGSELDPGFAAYSTILTGTWTASGGNYVFTDTVGSQSRPGVSWPSLSLSAGWYRLVISVASITGATQIRADGLGASDLLFGTGTHTFTVYVSAASTPRFRLEDLSTTINDGFALSSVSVKALPGNHAVAANNGTARPVLRARYNLLTYSEQFEGGIKWVKSAATNIGVNAATAPDGTTTAELVQDSNVGGTGNSYVYQNVTLAVNQSYTLSFYLKDAGLTSYAAIRTFSFDAAANGYTFVNLSTGSIVSSDAAHTSTITNAGNGWYRVVVGFTMGATDTVGIVGVYLSQDGTSITVDLDGTSGIYIWGAQLVANSVFPQNTYQRIAAATDYATGADFPPYLAFTTDDAMSTASIDFSGTDEMTVFAGVTKNSDAAAGCLIELSANYNAFNGTFTVFAPGSNFPTGFDTPYRGTSTVTAPGFAAAAPTTKIITNLYDISSPSAIIRSNGSQVFSSTTSAGTGNFGNYPLYIGARNKSASFLNGSLYSLIVRGKTTLPSEITATEAWVADKTGVTL